jgi:hypothetical protein
LCLTNYTLFYFNIILNAKGCPLPKSVSGMFGDY